MNKRSRAIALVLASAIALSSVPFSAYAAVYGVTTADNLNLRKSNSTSSASLGKLTKNTKVEVVSKTGDWYKVTVNGKTGYLLKTYVNLTSSTTSSTTSKTTTTAKATTTAKTTTTTSSSTSTLIGTAKKNETVYKTAKAASSNKLTTVNKGDSFKVIAQTSTFYKVQLNDKTGYIAKSSVTVRKQTTETKQKAETRPGDKVGYTTSTISKPADVVTGKMQVLNAINWNIQQMNPTFKIKVKNFDESMLPSKMSELERYFVESLDRTGETTKDGVTELSYSVTYNEAGQVVLDMVKGKSLASNATRAAEVKKIAEQIVKDTKGKSDYQKIVYIHDYVVKKAAYDDAMSDDSRTPYGVLVKGVASCQGYAETLQMLYTVTGIENRFVWATSRLSETGTHGFNKVKLAGKWYNVDATVDDPKDPNKIYTDAVRHDYLLVTDAVSSQRYSYEYSRYPAANTKNNWHQRNNLTASTQAELEKLVKAGAAKKQKYVSVWVDDYAGSKYKTGFAKTISNVSDVKVTTIQSYTPTKPYSTAIFFRITYK